MKWVPTLLLLCGVFVTPVDAFSRTSRSVKRMPARVAQAFNKRASLVEHQFRDNGAHWPPQKILLRAFKLEGELELWAPSAVKSSVFVKVRTFPICASSGTLGPKLESGDGQVPEGVYYIDRFNPWSSYHLSLGLNYPNRLDRNRSGDRDPGGDIFVHGNCVTIGCLPLQNTPMEDLYIAAVHARKAGQRRIPVHMAPCRFDTEGCEEALRSNGTQHPRLWGSLRSIHRRFEATHMPPRIQVDKEGMYRLAKPSSPSSNRLGQSSAPRQPQERPGISLPREISPGWRGRWSRKRSSRHRLNDRA
jgi:murein L,D-transpeptidase YafK